MQPLPEEILADLRRTLDTVLAPALNDDFAREQATLMSSLLEHLRLRITCEWEHLVGDSRQMRAALGKMPLPAELAAELNEVTDHSSAAVSLQELRAENSKLRGVLAKVVDASAEWTDRGSLQELLRDQLDRDRAVIGPGYRMGS